MNISIGMSFILSVNELLRVQQKSNLTNDSSFEPPRQADLAKIIDITQKIFDRSARRGGSNELSFVKFDFL